MGRRFRGLLLLFGQNAEAEMHHPQFSHHRGGVDEWIGILLTEGAVQFIEQQPEPHPAVESAEKGAGFPVSRIVTQNPGREGLYIQSD